MTSTNAAIKTSGFVTMAPIRERIESGIDALLGSLPDPEFLSVDQQRGIIGRYTAVLEGNFIYWMTGTLLSVQSDESREIVLENLREEVRDCHPGMMRRFAVAARSVPTETDALAVYPDLTKVRLFLGRLSGVQNLLMMGFFEGFIQKFMSYLADLAKRQGSTDMEYTDVHGVCDITHTEELFRALSVEMALNPPGTDTDLFEGVDILAQMLRTIIHSDSVRPMVAKAASVASY